MLTILSIIQAIIKPLVARNHFPLIDKFTDPRYMQFSPSEYHGQIIKLRIAQFLMRLKKPSYQKRAQFVCSNQRSNCTSHKKTVAKSIFIEFDYSLSPLSKRGLLPNIVLSFQGIFTLSFP